MRFTKWIAGVVVAVFCASFGWAQGSVNVDATDADVLRVMMQNAGYVVTQDIDSDGDPRLRGKISRSNYVVNFYGCRDGKNCTHLVFVAAWNKSEGFDLGKINVWNRDKVWGKAYLDDESDPVMELVTNMRHGVSAENFLDTVDWWRLTIEEFEGFIEW